MDDELFKQNYDDAQLGAIISDGIDGHIVIIGFPYDEGVIRNGGRRGSELGPDCVRRFLSKIGPILNCELGLTIEHVRVTDYGNIVQDTFDLAHAKLAAKVATVLLKPQAPRTIVVGGGGDQSYSNAKGFLTYCEQKGFKPVVVNANSHIDVKELREGLFSGCQFRMVLEDPLFRRLGGRFVQFAAQGTQCKKSEVDFLSHSGGQISYLSDIRNVTFSAVTPSYGRKIMTQAGFSFHEILSQCAENEKVFFSFTLDAINSAFCPGVSCPSVVGGLTAEEAVEMSMVAGASGHVLLMDISEFSPAIEDFRTGRLVSNLIYHFILGSVKPS